MDWIGWIRGPVGAALQWFEAHPGTASWLEAIGSITAIVFVYLFTLYQGCRTRIARKHRSDQESAGTSASSYSRADRLQVQNRSGYHSRRQTCAPDEVMHLLDQLYILGVETETPLLSVTASAAPILPQRTMFGSRWQAFP